MKNQTSISLLLGISIILEGCKSNQKEYNSLSKFEKAIVSFSPKTVEERMRLKNYVINLDLDDVNESEREFIERRYKNQKCPEILKNERIILNMHGLNYKNPSRQEMLYMHRVAKNLAEIIEIK